MAFSTADLKRDLDIVLLDATEPFGFEHVFPRGTLREPLAGLARADVVVLSRADMLDSESRAQIRDRECNDCSAGAGARSNIVWRRSSIASVNEVDAQICLPANASPRFAGSAIPPAFDTRSIHLGCEVVAWREFPDHHNYTRDDVVALSSMGPTSRCPGLHAQRSGETPRADAG